MRRVRHLFAVVALPALLLGACSEEVAGPTQEQYAASADGVCKATDDKIAALYEERDLATWVAAEEGESYTYGDRPERWVRAKLVPEYRRMSGGLKSLAAPDGDAAYLRDLYADLDARIEVLHRRPSDGRDAIRADTELQDRFTSYGMEVCPV